MNLIPEEDVTELQKSHDYLVQMLIMLVDQSVRGTHTPKVIQLKLALAALQTATPLMQDKKVGDLLAGSVEDIDAYLNDMIAKK